MEKLYCPLPAIIDCLVDKDKGHADLATDFFNSEYLEKVLDDSSMEELESLDLSDITKLLKDAGYDFTEEDKKVMYLLAASSKLDTLVKLKDQTLFPFEVEVETMGKKWKIVFNSKTDAQYEEIK